MAGVGFVLRKLTARGDLLGVAQGYLHASISTSGGWLFTLLTLSAISTFGPRFASYDDLSNFCLIMPSSHSKLGTPDGFHPLPNLSARSKAYGPNPAM